MNEFDKIALVRCAACRERSAGSSKPRGYVDMRRDGAGLYYVCCRDCGEESPRFVHLESAVIWWKANNAIPREEAAAYAVLRTAE